MNSMLECYLPNLLGCSEHQQFITPITALTSGGVMGYSCPLCVVGVPAGPIGAAAPAPIAAAAAAPIQKTWIDSCSIM